MPEFYIQRKLHGRDRLIQDYELLGQSGVFVVLAEPGAGKTDLLDYLAENYSVPREPATIFVLRPQTSQTVLVIDGLDEVARIGEEKINEIIVKARASGAGAVIFASRSYVWDEAQTAIVRDCFGTAPTILRLEPFDDDEQRRLFENYLPSENFEAFKAEADRFELTPILGNPQFLKLIADAYVEGDRRFSSKRQIYADAVRRLASERSGAAGAKTRPPTDAIVAAANEVFAKLLLSGAAGVSTNEEIGDDAYPYLVGLGPDDELATFALNTRLFKPTGLVNRHDPVHRIVAEYCAADFLVKRIEDPANTFSVRRCLAIIAPNGTVRNELRGLLGWMASSGDRPIQEAVIDLDPYAVFANGDASQLLASCKRRLLQGLRSLADVDPFFRRMDSWRRFNVGGFFSADMIKHVRPLLAPRHAKSHLRGLLLELLNGTEAANGLERELRAIFHDVTAEETEREQTYRNLVAMSKGDDPNDFDILVGEASRNALDLASQMLVQNGFDRFGNTRVLSFLRALAQLYPTTPARERRAGSRHFIRKVIDTFDLNQTRFLLNEATSSLGCTCGEAKPHRCNCRGGRSKIAAYLLDRYFEVMVGPHDPRQIARWTRPLVFRGHLNQDSSISVDALTTNVGLRRSVQLLALDGLSDQEQIGEAFGWLWSGTAHSGLGLREGDYQAIVDHAHATRNYALWEYLIVRHSPYTKRTGPDEVRGHMRSQARETHDFLRIWAKVNRDHRERVRREFVRIGRSGRHHRRIEAKQKAEALAHYKDNLAQIEAGRHWGWLKVLAQRYLYGPDGDDHLIDDPQIVENALLNCFDFVAPNTPSLETLADSRGTAVAMVLEAACLAKFRKTGSLEGIPVNILQAVKAEGIGGSGYQEGELERFQAHVDGLLFITNADARDFAVRFLEPQLTREPDATNQIPMLGHGSAFRDVKGDISLDWLTRYLAMPWYSQETLFGIAAVHADRSRLNALIETRCNDPIDPSERGVRRRKFWLLRHFFFIVPTSDSRWAEFSADPNAILQIEQYAGRLTRHDSEGWPHLNAEQVYRVLDAFVTKWPKVHLPNSWGSSDPENETAYRFLTDVVFLIGRDNPSNSIPVFDRVLTDNRFRDLHSAVKSQRAAAIRQQALSGFRAPRAVDISKLLDESKIASVEDMRALLVELLDEIQGRLKGAATNPVDVFYSGGKRIDENTARNRIVDMLEARLNALNLGVVIEHQMADAKRCDFTASTSINGSPIVLVTEIKGQWNKELYTAASVQLAGRYTIYPGAADQGVYLVLWFGDNVTVAGRKAPSITSADLLREEIVQSMPADLLGRIDVYVLDVSRAKKVKKASTAKTSRGKSAKKSPSKSKPAKKKLGKTTAVKPARKSRVKSIKTTTKAPAKPARKPKTRPAKKSRAKPGQVGRAKLSRKNRSVRAKKSGRR